MATPQEHFAAARQFQEYYDQTLSKIGTRAPTPALGQTVNDYRRETLRQLKRTFLPQNNEYYRVQYRQLRDDALDAIEPLFLKVIEKEAIDPKNFAPGEIRGITKIDPQTGNKRIDYYGQESFVKDMMRPGRRVVSFTTDRGRFDASGRPLR